MNEQVRRTIASYTTYQEAERAVDHLSDQGFPVERVAIIGQDVRLVEQVAGRLGYGGAALQGAASGALPGALIGWIFGLLDWLNPVVSGLLLALYGLVFGALVGALLGLLVHTAQRGRRDFASVSFMQPSRYDVVADEAVADEAVQMLAEFPSWTGAGTSSGAWKSSRPPGGPTVT
ncbi:general stress protein [Streptomyces sp. NPDC047072]|uniref:general stress protein n=1 Tax=Streptomyces sp. NPDC047072 TaxID=3154809 RepID=UPI0033C8FBB7